MLAEKESLKKMLVECQKPNSTKDLLSYILELGRLLHENSFLKLACTKVISGKKITKNSLNNLITDIPNKTEQKSPTAYEESIEYNVIYVTSIYNTYNLYYPESVELESISSPEERYSQESLYEAIHTTLFPSDKRPSIERFEFFKKEDLKKIISKTLSYFLSQIASKQSLSYDQSDGILYVANQEVSFTSIRQKELVGLFFPNGEPTRKELTIDEIHKDIFQTLADNLKLETQEKDQVYGITRDINKKIQKTLPTEENFLEATGLGSYLINPNFNKNS